MNINQKFILWSIQNLRILFCWISLKISKFIYGRYNQKYYPTRIKKLVKDLHAKPGVSKIGNLQNTIDAMVGKELTPTQALRKIRSTLGKESNRASRGVGPNISSDQVLNNFYKQSHHPVFLH